MLTVATATVGQNAPEHRKKHCANHLLRNIQAPQFSRNLWIQGAQWAFASETHSCSISDLRALHVKDLTIGPSPLPDHPLLEHGVNGAVEGC
jgi:hypothetical protein